MITTVPPVLLLVRVSLEVLIVVQLLAPVPLLLLLAGDETVVLKLTIFMGITDKKRPRDYKIFSINLKKETESVPLPP